MNTSGAECGNLSRARTGIQITVHWIIHYQPLVLVRFAPQGPDEISHLWLARTNNRGGPRAILVNRTLTYYCYDSQVSSASIAGAGPDDVGHR